MRALGGAQPRSSKIETDDGWTRVCSTFHSHDHPILLLLAIVDSDVWATSVLFWVVHVQDTTAAAWSNETVDKIMSTVDLSRSIITVVAHALLPPPGGSVVGALLTMVHAVVQQSLCSQEMTALTCRAAGYLNMICTYYGSLQSQKLSKCLTDFHSALLAVTHLYRGEKEKGYLRKLISSGQGLRDIAECEGQLAEAMANLMMGLTLDSHEAVLDVKRMLAKALEMQEGGPKFAEEMQRSMKELVAGGWERCLL